MFLKFLNCFAIFLWILKIGSSKNGSEREKKKEILFFGHSWPVSTWNDAQMILFNFKIFWEFSCSGRLKTVRTKKIFFFFSFSASPDPFRLEMEPGWCFLIFCIFLLFYWEFSSSGRLKMVPNEEKIFPPFWLQMKPGWCSLIFLNVFAILFGIL